MGRRNRNTEAREEMIAECRERLGDVLEAPEAAQREAADAFDAMLVLVSLERKYEDEPSDRRLGYRARDAIAAAIHRAYACGLRAGRRGVSDSVLEPPTGVERGT